MLVADPCLYGPPQVPGDSKHPLGFDIRNRARALIIGDVSFLSKTIELCSPDFQPADGKGEGLDNAEVVSLATSAKTSRGQSRGRT